VESIKGSGDRFSRKYVAESRGAGKRGRTIGRPTVGCMSIREIGNEYCRGRDGRGGPSLAVGASGGSARGTWIGPEPLPFRRVGAV
jgi:hypothetical protein